MAASTSSLLELTRMQSKSVNGKLPSASVDENKRLDNPVDNPLVIPPIDQFTPPLVREESAWGLHPWFLKEGRQIVRFDIAALLHFRALITLNRTFLLERKTWQNMGILFVLAALAAIIVGVTGHSKSVEEEASEDGSVGNIQALMSFVLSGYITIVVNRWDTLRNTTLGTLWGSLENLVVFGLYVTDKHKDRIEIVRCREDLIRYVRIIMRLLFAAGRQQDNLDSLRDGGLLVDAEYEYLSAAMIGTRPLMAIMWLWRIFDKMQEAGVQITEEGRLLIQTNVDAARGGVGATLGMIGCPYPYAYAHVIHWVVQIYIWVLAVDTGVGFACQYMRTGNGEDSYSADDREGYVFPVLGYVWLTNNYLQQLAGNIAYILFAQGMLKTMLKMHNPFNDENTSFPEMAYDSFIHNNCRAMMMGISQFDVMCAHNGREKNVGCAGFDGGEDTFEQQRQPS